MKIVALSIRDFKGLKDVEIRPDPTLVVITGKNESGKTSCLDAVEALLCGPKGTPARPVRSGCDRAVVSADMDEYTVTRTFRPDGTSTLTVKDREGGRPSSPQTLLERLFRRVTFCPETVTKMDGKQLAAILRQLAGLDEVFAAIDTQIKQAEEERTRVNRDVKADEGTLRNYPSESELAGVPDDETGATELMEQYRDAVNEASMNAEIRHDAKRAHDAVKAQYAVALKADAKADELHAQFKKAEQDAADAHAEHLRLVDEMKEAEGLTDGLVDPDTAALQSRLKTVEDENARVRKKRERQAVYDRWATNREEAVELTSAIESLRVEKQIRLAEAKYPVEELSVVNDEVRWNGVLIEQVSSARKIRLGLAIGAALNPTIRVALLREASLLDRDAFEAVKEWAVGNDYQVFAELVGSSDSEEGIVIEDGMVVADRQRPRPTPAGRKKPKDAKQEAYDDSVRQASELF